MRFESATHAFRKIVMDDIRERLNWILCNPVGSEIEKLVEVCGLLLLRVEELEDKLQPRFVALPHVGQIELRDHYD